MNILLKRNYGWNEFPMLGIIFLVWMFFVLVVIGDDFSLVENLRVISLLFIVNIILTFFFFNRIKPFSILIREKEIFFNSFFQNISIKFDAISFVYMDCAGDITRELALNPGLDPDLWGNNERYFLYIQGSHNKKIKIDLLGLSKEDTSELFNVLLEKVEVIKNNSLFISAAQNPNIFSYRAIINAQKDFEPTSVWYFTRKNDFLIPNWVGILIALWFIFGSMWLLYVIQKDTVALISFIQIG